MVNPFFDLFRSTTVKDITPDGRLVCLAEKDLFPKVLAILAGRDHEVVEKLRPSHVAMLAGGDGEWGYIQSAPVFNHDGDYIGVLDGVTCFRFVMKHIRENRRKMMPCLRGFTAGHILRATHADAACARGYGETRDVLAARMVMEEENLIHLAKSFTKGYHHVVVTDGQGHVRNMCSQSDLIRFVQKHMHQAPFRELAGILVRDIKDFDEEKVVSVKVEDPLLHALFKMYEEHAGVVAVVDCTGRLAGQLHPLDIRAMFKTIPHFDIPGSTTFDFLSQRPVKCRNPSKVSMDTPLSTLLELVVHERLHYVFVCDTHNRPQGVLSLSDIMDTWTLSAIFAAS